MKAIRKSVSILLSLVMVVSLFTIIPFEISAVSLVDYIDENGDLQTAANVTELTEGSTTPYLPGTEIDKGGIH